MNRRSAAALLLSFSLLGAAQAGKTEGMAAYNQGRYGVALDELTGAALQGDRDAALRVGLMHWRGQGTEANPGLAFYWFQEATKGANTQSSAEAYGHLAELYLAGEGVPQSDIDAAYNADAAAQQGYAPAQLLLGKLLLEGRGHPAGPDPTAARHWFGQAAEAGNAEAQYRLGQLLETDEGGDQDLPEALKWYQAASQAGYKAASEALTRLRPGIPLQPASAATVSPPRPLPSPQTAKRRIALLIANADYAAPIADLRGPVNDVRLLEKVLTDVGFSVVTKTNLGLSDLKREVMGFLDSVDGNTVSLLYYSGHGVEMGGVNYLLPTDFAAGPNMTAGQAEELSFDIASAYARMTAKAEGSLNITILDACRDNPFAPLGKGIGSEGGLKNLTISAGRGKAIETLTAYAAESGQRAEDTLPTQENSPYALALAAEIPVVGQPVETVFRNVGSLVHETTQRKQRPVYTSGLMSEFFFVPAK
ncbi:caspase family protein [Deinococcus lacus]|uniref:Caspase family protein n=1 Tax=Deinococcus lacus TaxID=392561 RepID=A0ABW1YEP5_9DEIO